MHLTSPQKLKQFLLWQQCAKEESHSVDPKILVKTLFYDNRSDERMEVPNNAPIVLG